MTDILTFLGLLLYFFIYAIGVLTEDVSCWVSS